MTDAEKYCKDCPDFVALDDGTTTGEYRYCNLSLICRQTGFNGLKLVNMESNYLPVRDPFTGEVVEWQYFCTGMHDNRPLSEREIDELIS